MIKKHVSVLHLLWDGDLGGVQRYVNKVFSSDHWRGFKHSICFFRDSGTIINNAAMPNCSMHQLGLQKGWQIWKTKPLKGIIARENVDLIHCHCDTPAFQLQVKYFKDWGLVFTEHGDFLMRSKRQWFSEGMWLIYGHCWNRILLNSSFTMEDFVKRFPHLKEQCHVLLNPLLEQPPQRVGEKKLGLNVGVFCRLVPQKGVDWFIQIAAKIHQNNAGVKFHIYGDGPLRDELKRLVLYHKLENSVDFHGFVQNPLLEMQQMSCVVIPSRIEPFGLAALEAQSVGIPVVAFQESGVGEIVLSGKTGYLVSHGNLDDMASAVSRVLASAELAKALGERAFLYAREKFSLEKHIEILSNHYLSICKEKGIFL